MNPKSTYMKNIFGDPSTGILGKVNNLVYGNPLGPTAPKAPAAVAQAPVATPSAPQATAPKPTVIAPAKTPAKTSTTLPPSGQSYVSNLAGTTATPAYDNKTGLLTEYGKSQGLPEVNGGQNSSTTSPGGENSTTDPTATPTATESPYLTYLKSLFDPEALKTSKANITELNQRTSDELLRARGTEDTLRKNEIGQLRIGQDAGIAENARLSNKSLADLAIAKGSATDIYNDMISAGKTVLEAETAAKKAADDAAQTKVVNSQKDRELTNTETKTAADIAKNKRDQELDEKKYQEDKRQFGLEYALKARETAVLERKAAADNPNSPTALAAKDAEAAGSLNLINQLISNPGVKGISGSLQGGLKLGNLSLNSDVQLARNQYDQVKGMLALENRSKLKGQGAVSDFEGRVLNSAASSLGRNLGDEEFIKQLKQVRGAIATSHGQTADVLITDPKSGQSQVVNSNSAAIAQAVKDGLIVVYQ